MLNTVIGLNGRFAKIDYYRKKEKSIVPINKDEKETLLKRFPKMHIVRLMKQDSKRHHYWMSEEPQYLQALNEIRQKNTI